MLKLCEACRHDETIICPRDVDVQCLHCGGTYCGGHIGPHLATEHFVALELDYCREASYEH